VLKNTMNGPFFLFDEVIDREITSTGPGVFALDDSLTGSLFDARFVGRSDSDLNHQLHVFVGKYKRFGFVACSSARQAFETECRLFHELSPWENVSHPQRPENSGWICPCCTLFF